MRWVKDIPLVELTAWYEIIGGGWRLDALWGGNEIEQYEKTLWGIMMPSENESQLLSAASDANKTAKMVSNIIDFAKETISREEIKALLGQMRKAYFIHIINSTSLFQVYQYQIIYACSKMPMVPNMLHACL